MDLQAILDSHTMWLRDPSTGQRADLRYADLEDANLRHANLRHVTLRYANLTDADLRHVDLRYADLDGTDLRHADLKHADLRHANLTGVDLRHADLRYADLEGADLRHANLKDADARHADLEGADVRYADLEDAITIDCNFEGSRNDMALHDQAEELRRQVAGDADPEDEQTYDGLKASVPRMRRLADLWVRRAKHDLHLAEQHLEFCRQRLESATADYGLITDVCEFHDIDTTENDNA